MPRQSPASALSAALLASAAWSRGVTGFQPLVRGGRGGGRTALFSEVERVKSAGGGTDAAFPVGSLELFDPELEGKLQGTGSLQERISSGPDYVPRSSSYLADPAPASGAEVPAVPPGATLLDAQHWLEHLDDGPGVLPLNFAKPSKPVQATVLAAQRIISADAPGDIQHIVLRLPEGMHYVEGQSLSVIPPGNDPRSGKPNKPRLYSIASTRYGDALDGGTVSLCVRRAEYYDPVTGQVDPAKKGVCSNYLCDAPPGTSVSVAGPVGKTMLLPEDPARDIIMVVDVLVATGTGIAPFRAFLHRLFMEETVARHRFTGTAWLVLGVPVAGGLLYREEIEAMQRNAAQPGQLRVDYAISREMNNPFDGSKMYVQHVMQQNAEELFQRIDAGAVVYFCGLKGMMPPILDTLEQVAVSKGIDWSAKMKELKANGQWHVEVY